MLKVESLELTFGNTTLFRDLDLEVQAGNVIHLKGGNGSGKSSFLRCIAGQHRPTGGKVVVRSQPVANLAPWQIEHYLPLADQEPQLDLTVIALDNLIDSVYLGTGLTWLRKSRSSSRRHALAASRSDLKALNILPVIERPTYELSYGQRKLLALARCLRPLPGNIPRILLLDEPLAGIHPKLFGAILSLARERLTWGWSVLVVEHLEVVDSLGAGREITFPFRKEEV